ncbi:MAG: hypothetical protein AB7I68_11450 [Porticoccaceae bacterium]
MNLLQHLIRPDDLLNLWIETDNLRLDADPGDGAAASVDGQGAIPTLVVDDPRRPGLLTVIFPPQHIAEQAVFETPPFTGDPDPNRPPAEPPGTPDEPRPAPGHFKARIAQSSRLVFEVPNGHRIPYTIEGLLDWSALAPRLHPIAALGEQATAAERAAAPTLSVPDAHQTVLELPYALLISPGTTGVWQHRLTPATHGGRSELWHTRLALRGPDGTITELDAEHTAPLRALWSTDRADTQNDISNTPGIGRTALAPDDRRQLVILTSAFHGYETNPDRAPKTFVTFDLATGYLRNLRPWRRTPAPYVPLPFHARQLMLSPLGGWLKSRGKWEPPRPAQPSRWLEAIDVLRDRHWADVLAPIARRAAAPLLRADKASDRLLEMFVPAAPVAAAGALDLSEWVHVATQGRDHYVRVVYEGELWPFRHRAALVKITEREFRRNSASGLVVACLVQRMFIVVREPEKTLDRRDNPFTRVRLTTLITPDLAEPLVNAPFHRTFWVEVGPGAQRQKFHFHAIGTDQANRAVDFTIPLVFASITDVDKRIADVAGLYNADSQRGADAPGHKIAYTPLRGTENALLASQSLLFDADPSGANPALHSAAVHISQLEDLLGNSAPADIAYDSTYTTKGYDAANRTGVFATLITPQPLAFRADQAGGIATPNQILTALSDQQGPVAGDVAKARADNFDPAAYFPKGAPRLFGTFDLLDLLLATGGLAKQAPMLKSERIGNTLVTSLHWQPAVQKVDLDIAKFLPKESPAGTIISVLKIDSRIESPLTGATAPRSEFTGSLTDFDIEILSSVTLHFVRFGFASVNGAKPDVSVALHDDHPLSFTGDLQFVEELRKAIPPGLFGKGASIELIGAGVRAGFAIALPPLEIGVFALKDVSLGAALTLPFLDGKPLFDFNVSERANPFQLRVAFFAGGGFFHLQLDTAGMRQLEAALEFGAAFGLNLGVASGEVHAMAGIYFAIQKESDGKELCRLTGYLRLGGRLSVLGLIRISIEFNLSFTYDGGTDKAYGRATLTVQVEVLFFSVSVDLTVERAFGGSGDPLFLQTFDTAQRWQDYTGAFA